MTDIAMESPIRTAAEIVAEIVELEAAQARPVREFALSGSRDLQALARIQEINAQIAALRLELRRA